MEELSKYSLTERFKGKMLMKLTDLSLAQLPKNMRGTLIFVLLHLVLLLRVVVFGLIPIIVGDALTAML